MNKDKELEELTEIVKIGREFKKSHKGIAVRIQLNGYTKKHFPVEELKERLNEIKENYEKYNFENIRLFGKNPIQVVLDKIKELEDGT